MQSSRHERRKLELFHTYSTEGEKRGENVEQKHQRGTEEWEKERKSCEIFSTGTQQVVKSARQGYGLITMTNGCRLYRTYINVHFIFT